jgi:hypothetical protein
MFLCRIYYRKYKQPIFYNKGKNNYLLYTEDKNVYKRMEEF